MRESLFRLNAKISEILGVETKLVRGGKRSC